jgi:N-acetylglutamate synthase-like GNAT family acetyltransferase
MVVAELDGDVVGVARMQEFGDIVLCYILPEVRFIGVGKALLEQLVSKAKELGLRELRLHSTKTAQA